MSQDSIYCQNTSIFRNTTTRRRQLLSAKEKIFNAFKKRFLSVVNDLLDDAIDNTLKANTDIPSKYSVINETNSTTNQSEIETATAINYYFIPINTIESDVSFSQIIEDSQDDSFKDYFVGNLSKVVKPELSSIEAISEVSIIEPEFEGAMQVTAGSNWIKIENLKLKTKGFILGIADPIEYEIIVKEQNSEEKDKIIDDSFFGVNSTDLDENSTTQNETELNTIEDNSTLRILQAKIKQEKSILKREKFQKAVKYIQAHKQKSRRMLQDEIQTIDDQNELNISAIPLLPPTSISEPINPQFPTQYQVKFSKNYNGTVTSKYSLSYYNYTTISLTFLGLNSSCYYNIFIIGTSEDPSENALLTEVLELQAMTDLGEDKQGERKQVMIIVMLMVVVWCVFFNF